MHQKISQLFLQCATISGHLVDSSDDETGVYKGALHARAMDVNVDKQFRNKPAASISTVDVARIPALTAASWYAQCC